ncbi:MAG: adenosine deaminase [Deltaproteobacteria bacterium]|nr:MAG: adenosine deaminase [Deltaproteobacteria bacterium]TMB45563.1 MAG: adenosine deaminase [Deltaproteobacteria bacterium]
MDDRRVPTDLATLPKAEVHIHLEGAIRPATLDEFSRRAGLRVPRTFSDLNGFIRAISGAWTTMMHAGDYARLVREYCEDAVRSGIRYAELELVPGGRPYDCLGEAVEAAARQRDIVVRFVAGLNRDLPLELAWMMLEAAKGVPEVVAVGLGGAESGFPPEPFSKLFAEARRRGLRSAPHAGEDAGPASVRGALDALGAERIQHGVRAVEDPALLAELAARGIPLAVCPTSNLRLGVVASLDAHPLRQLWEAGVRVSVNTDDPGFFGCDLVGEYAIAGRLLGLDRAGYARLARNSVESSFAPEAVKADLRAAIAEWV